jgi:hypothetical protein
MQHVKNPRLMSKVTENISFFENNYEVIASKAHAIPEVIGNKSLFSYYECDDCNKRIFHRLDNHLANLLGLWRTFAQISGKSGIPSYKTKRGSRIDFHNHIEGLGLGFLFNIYHNEPLVENNENVNELVISGIRQEYIPINVLKCLTKAAISIMPESELIHFQGTIKWILADTSEDGISFKSLPLLYEFV